MEIRKRKTLTGVFVRVICIFSANTVLLVLFMAFLFDVLIRTGAVMPANYMEQWIDENKDEVITSKKVTDQMFPPGTSYGVYGNLGEFLYGNFKKEECRKAWEAYKENDVYADGGGYRFLIRKNGEVCIVRYEIKVRAANAFLRKYLPAPDLCIVILFLILFLVQAALVSRHFARELSKRLRALGNVTEKIRRQDLEMGEEHSDIQEIEDVLLSLSHMGEALKRSLKEQWELEHHKKEQIAALAHDIKTPLTVIRGNAELLSEENLDAPGREYTEYIRENAQEIDRYLMLLGDMLLSEDAQAQEEAVPAGELADRLISRARMLAAGYSSGRTEVEVKRDPSFSGEIICDVGQIQRAWDNVITNALGITPDEGRRSVIVAVEQTEDAGKRYLAARVTDRGKGFTEEALLHAKEQFYQGDKSRHEKGHRGLGLYTASRFAARQGGSLVLENAWEEGCGGRVSLMLRMGEKACADAE